MSRDGGNQIQEHQADLVLGLPENESVPAFAYRLHNYLPCGVPETVATNIALASFYLFVSEI